MEIDGPGRPGHAVQNLQHVPPFLLEGFGCLVLFLAVFHDRRLFCDLSSRESKRVFGTFSACAFSKPRLGLRMGDFTLGISRISGKSGTSLLRSESSP